MPRIAIYDLDKTIVKTPTFTAFLVFAARRMGRDLWWRVPLWIVALIGYGLKLYGRKAMKQFGVRLFIGSEIAQNVASELAREFAENIIPSDLQPGAVAAMEADRAAGCRMVIATAAPELYASVVAQMLSFDDVIATRHKILPGGAISNRIDGENCYAGEKLARVESWLADQGIERSQCHIICYSDHPSDAPLLNWANEAILVTANSKLQPLAEKQRWKIADFS